MLTRTKHVLDEQAWGELSAMLIKLLDRADELEKEAAKRLRNDGHEGERRAGLALMLFESMPSVPGADAAKTPASSTSGRRKSSRARVTA